MPFKETSPVAERIALMVEFEMGSSRRPSCANMASAGKRSAMLSNPRPEAGNGHLDEQHERQR
jgi:hypothetical protein